MRVFAVAFLASLIAAAAFAWMIGPALAPRADSLGITQEALAGDAETRECDA